MQESSSETGIAIAKLERQSKRRLALAGGGLLILIGASSAEPLAVEDSTFLKLILVGGVGAAVCYKSMLSGMNKDLRIDELRNQGPTEKFLELSD